MIFNVKNVEKASAEYLVYKDIFTRRTTVKLIFNAMIVVNASKENITWTDIKLNIMANVEMLFLSVKNVENASRRSATYSTISNYTVIRVH